MGGGNNSDLVKRVLGKRDHWEETTSANTLFNFKWIQDNKGYHYERVIPDAVCRQLLNHFEFHKEISTKSGLIENLAQYCDVNYLNIKNPYYLYKFLIYSAKPIRTLRFNTYNLCSGP